MIRNKHNITTIEGKLCIQYYILLQQLTFKKKLKDETYKEYNSYLIKFPRPIKELIATDDVYLEKSGNTFYLRNKEVENAKKIRIQKSKSGKDNIAYQLTIPRKLFKITNYQSGKTYILCQVLSSNNKEGYEITLELL